MTVSPDTPNSVRFVRYPLPFYGMYGVLAIDATGEDVKVLECAHAADHAEADHIIDKLYEYNPIDEMRRIAAETTAAFSDLPTVWE